MYILHYMVARHEEDPAELALQHGEGEAQLRQGVGEVAGLYLHVYLGIYIYIYIYIYT